MGHTISFFITLALMVLVGGVLAREAAHGPRSYAPTRRQRLGPFATFVAAALLIMCEPTRHILTDQGIWVECGNNPHYDRINSSDPFPPACFGAGGQYRCTQTCCVSTWQPLDPADPSSDFAWRPPTPDFFPHTAHSRPFATLRADGTVYLPRGRYASSTGPYALYEASAASPLVFFATGDVNPLRRATPAKSCAYGVNAATGYCFLTNQSLPYEEQLLQLPLADPAKPHNATSNPHTCGCDQCVPDADESLAHLSPVGVISTVLCTYTGFILLAVAVAWNANIATKLRKVGEQWRELRGINR